MFFNGGVPFLKGLIIKKRKSGGIKHLLILP
jgi:hypothetical protein